ncbi:MAG: hypothetical protein IJ825_07070, partial [Oscillospiraceae bacterium]|nr:hypothetical protein [Oscillospiraceae bacterium]
GRVERLLITADGAACEHGEVVCRDYVVHKLTLQSLKIQHTHLLYYICKNFARVFLLFLKKDVYGGVLRKNAEHSDCTGLQAAVHP